MKYKGKLNQNGKEMPSFLGLSRNSYNGKVPETKMNLMCLRNPEGWCGRWVRERIEGGSGHRGGRAIRVMEFDFLNYY